MGSDLHPSGEDAAGVARSAALEPHVRHGVDTGSGTRTTSKAAISIGAVVSVVVA